MSSGHIRAERAPLGRVIEVQKYNLTFNASSRSRVHLIVPLRLLMDKDISAEFKSVADVWSV